MTGNIDNLALRAHLGVSFQDAVKTVMSALKDEGFGVLTQIDVKATLKKKLDVDFKNYVILGACNPPLAYRALQAEQEIGLLLPCNVVVYQEGDGSVVSIVDPLSMMEIAGEDMEAVAIEARERLLNVINRVKDTG